MTYALEKRGYVKAGPWTPECTVEHPDGVRQLHREFQRAGADIIQAFTFSMDDDMESNHTKYGVCISMKTIIKSLRLLHCCVKSEGDPCSVQ
ncbi:hypothetical protein ACROYT_G034769 [Oculina patagonica]